MNRVPTPKKFSPFAAILGLRPYDPEPTKRINVLANEAQLAHHDRATDRLLAQSATLHEKLKKNLRRVSQAISDAVDSVRA